MATLAIGLSDIKLKIDTINGVAPQASANPFSASGSAMVSIGEVSEGSTQINDEAPTETKFKGDYTDATLMSLFQRGDFTMETDIIEVSGEKFSALTGGTWSSATKTITVPASSSNIVGQVIIGFDQGLSSIKLNKCQIVASYAGANIKTELFKLHLKVIALADSSGNVAELVLPA